MTANERPLIGVVGPCGSGKSTLIEQLDRQGYPTRHIAQEHSYVRDMWQRLSKPDILIYLNVSFQAASQRKKLNWNDRDFKEQLRRLEHAREHASLEIDTDGKSIQEVADLALSFLQSQSAT